MILNLQYKAYLKKLMPTTKKLLAKNSTDSMNVMVEFDLENQPVKVTSEEGTMEYNILSIVERHRLLTVRNPNDRVLFSIFYGNPS